MSPRSYWLSLPERFARSVLGLSAGVAREVGEIALPDGVRDSRLYQNTVDSTLRFLIERVGDVEGVYPDGDELPGDFLARRTAGNAIEALGLVAFRASPVWVLAALSDVSGAGRQLIPEIASALKAEGLLDADAEFTSVDAVLNGLERTCARLAGTINTPPLDVAALRDEWNALREESRTLQPASLPSLASIRGTWEALKTESARQHRSVFETSSLLAVSAARTIPDRARWLASSARVGAVRTGEVLAEGLLEHYRRSLLEIRTVGYVNYASRQLGPYVRAAVGQFDPERVTVTDRVVRWFEERRGRA